MKAEQVLALVRAHVRGDREQFASVALQIGCHEKSLGRWVGDEICRVVRSAPVTALSPLPKDRNGDGELMEVRPAGTSLADLVLHDGIAATLAALVSEHRHADALRSAGVSPAVRVLFDGPPGTGKASAAGAVADALGVPLVVVRHEVVIGSYLGDTSKSLRKVFEFAGSNRCVILVDEFDSFGRLRGGRGDVGEMNRILNVLLQLMDRHDGPALVVAATNLPDALDGALPRRFDLSVHFDRPAESHRLELIRRTLGDADGPFAGSHAEIVRDCLKEKKRRILAGLSDRLA